jgi:hypothetical protein
MVLLRLARALVDGGTLLGLQYPTLKIMQTTKKLLTHRILLFLLILRTEVHFLLRVTSPIQIANRTQTLEASGEMCPDSPNEVAFRT